MISNDANESKDKNIPKSNSNLSNTNVNNNVDSKENSQYTELASQKPYIQVAKNEVIGIGGKTGMINSSNYDVNKLKNNLVQKSIQQFKKDLLLLLIETGNENQKDRKRSFNIEEKLAALISANPVATTTDSNLLEGTWELAFATSNAVEILDEARFIYSRKKDKISPEQEENVNWKLSSNRMENPLHTFQRSVYLEELGDDEDPFMVDTIILFSGLWKVQRFYDIIGLTRTSLELIPSSKIIYFCGKQIMNKMADENDSLTKELSLIYLDSDICVSMTGGDKDNLQVYTKNQEWIESRMTRKHVLRATLSWLNTFETPFRIRRKISSFLHKEKKEHEEQDGMEEDYQILLRKVYDDKVSKLTALRLGDYGDSTEEDDGAWGGKDDPFVHLTADERQVIMKQMSIGEIKKAGHIQRRFAKKNKTRRSNTQKFKRPEEEYE